MTGRQTLTITLAMCGLLLTATVALWLVGPAAAAQADADSPTEAAKPAGDGSGPATQPTSATDPSKPQRVIVQVNRRRTIHGTLQMHDDELIVVRDRSGELHSFPVSRVMRVVKLVDPVPGQTGVVFLNNGQTREGVIIEDAYEHVLMEIEGIRAKLSRDHVDHVELKPTFQQQYESYKAQLQPGQTRNHLTLCHWLIDQRKYELARTELLELLKHDPENHEANRMMRIVEAQLELLAGGFRTSEDQRENGAEDGDGSKRSGPVYAKDLLPKEIISAEDVNIIRVYEIDFENPPRVSVSPETIRKLIEHYGTSELMPASQTERTELFRADAIEVVRLMFELRARELYPEIRVLSEPASMNQFRLRVHDAWLINNCATSRCHGGVDGGRLFLHRENYKSPRVRYTNFLILERLELDPQWPLINYQQPLMSLIIQHALPRKVARLPHPDVEGWRPSLTRGNQRVLDAAEQWIRSMYQPRPEYPVDYQPPQINQPPPEAGPSEQPSDSDRKAR